MTQKVRNLAVLTSGGDAPGMNAAIRAVVRVGIDKGWNVHGILQGYSGLIAGQFISLSSRDVSHIIEKGGTILGSSRSQELKTPEGIQKALQKLKEHKIDGLVVIGGNGSQKGAYQISLQGFPVVGIASTIDNDLYGSEMTIGVDTALNVALESIDRLKVTASSLGRIFVVEVMGRDSGYLALIAGITGGAEAIIIPEADTDLTQLLSEVESADKKGKTHLIIVVAEGAHYNGEALTQYLKQHLESTCFELRLTKLGHVQRGGTPSAFDRLLATELGAKAVEELTEGRANVLVGSIEGKIQTTPLVNVANHSKQLDMKLVKLARVLAR